MNERDCFMKAICESPDDDLPRLVFADWLEEHGEGERAEFIRVQCELEAEHVWDGGCEVCGEPGIGRWCAGCLSERDRRDALRCRERELFANRCRTWFPNPTDHEWKWDRPGEADHGNTYRGRSLFRRGFVQSLILTAADFLRVERGLLWCPTPCGKCEGTGLDNIGVINPNDLIGDWDVDRYKETFLRAYGFTPPSCPPCSGTGKVPPTDGCPACEGTGYRDRVVAKCYVCGKTGIVPRPFPATVQPIREVHLTTWNGYDETAWGHTLDARGGDHFGGSSFTSDRWPGVTFHLTNLTATPQGRPTPQIRRGFWIGTHNG
jgi:uncharacterized protein (TIGR02996 family)